MTRETERDDFEGIDINGPWGGIRIGSGGVRMGSWPHDDWGDDDGDIRRVRRRVRQKLNFYRNLFIYLAVVGGLALIDWTWGDGWWVQWVAIFWGAFVALEFMSTFVAPSVWGRDVEERMVRREIERRRGRVHVTPAGPPADADPKA
jgi:hypothetical protein